jgi:glycosyltransferase involved in cell wall biosynthesis
MSVERISVVIPVFNEAGNIAKLHSELRTSISALTKSLEIIYVDDASTDNSANELAGLVGATVITLQRRYGQATALMAGFTEATGDIIVSIDGDGQNDPADIPRLLATLEEKNLDVVTGWRRNRSDKRGIRILTRIGRGLRRFLINDEVHDTGCTLRVYRAAAAKSLSLHGEMHRYVLALLRWKGFTIGEVVVNDRPREHGVSKYGYSKAVRGTIDLMYVWFIYKYSARPLHLFGYMSLTSLALGIVSAGFTVYDRFVRDLHINRDGWFFLAFFFLIMAIMLFSFGVIIDLLMRIYLNTSPNEKPYYIRSVAKHL